MTKTELVKRVANNGLDGQGVRGTLAASVVDEVLAQIVAAISAGETVELKGFGTFKAYERKERIGRHPQTGVDMTFPASVTISFKAGSVFKNALNPKVAA